MLYDAVLKVMLYDAVRSIVIKDSFSRSGLSLKKVEGLSLANCLKSFIKCI